MFENVDYTLRENIAILKMNRPEALNALSSGMTSDLSAAIDKAVEDRARCVILTGEGRAFCSGGDLREMKTMWEREGRIEAFLEEPLEILHGLIVKIRETPIPFLAVVTGVCAGAGTNVALACDIVFAAEGTIFNEAFVKIGLSPDCGGSFFLPRAVGAKHAAELMMTGDSITAERAAAIGMINRVLPAEEIAEKSFEMAKRLAAGPTAAIARVKIMLNESSSNTLPEQLSLEHKLQLQSGRAADFKEGVAAFFAKRPAEFDGE